ncbi:MAG: efflux RND transporter permease subunit [Sphingobacteriales bacterium JAD_PAG50586_3]|nr:MAG: efflux RND transporter permease subunit [Sphingobacteriales bacterium JAD_PAG50586_3]
MPEYDLGVNVSKIKGVQSMLSITQLQNLVKDTTEGVFKFQKIMNRRPGTQAEVDSIKGEIYNMPFYDELLLNRKSNVTVMLLTLDRKIVDSKNRLALVTQITDLGDKFTQTTNIETHYSGLPYIRTINTKRLSSELILFSLLSILITAIVLFVIFRSFKAILIPMVVVFLSLIWSIGTVVLFGYKLSALTGLIPPLIIIIGIPNCIFITNIFHREFVNHGNKIKAIARVIVRMGMALFLTNFNTAVGFATFTFTESKILSEFGVVSSINVMLVFIFSIVHVPILFSYVDAPPPKHTKHLDYKWMANLVKRIMWLITHHRIAIYAVTVVLLGISVWGMTKMRTTGALTDDIPKRDKVYTDLVFLEDNFHGVMPFEIVVETEQKKGIVKYTTIKKIDEVQKILAEYPEFSRPVSIVEIIKYAKQAYYNGNPDQYGLPDRDELNFIYDYIPKGKDGKRDELTKPFIDSLQQKTRISVQVADIGSAEMKDLLKSVRPRIDSIFPKDKYKVTITGSSLVFVKGTDYLVDNLLWSLLAAIILISGLMAFMFSSFRMVLISIVPNLIPLVLTAGIMGFADISLRISTILVFNIAYGIAIDSAIHFFSVYGHELKKNTQDIKQSVEASLKETGFSIMYTSIILLFGFSIFMLSKFGGTQALGMLICITLFTSIFTNLLVLPSLLMSLDKVIMIKSLREPYAELYDEEIDIDLDSLEIKKIEDGN